MIRLSYLSSSKVPLEAECITPDFFLGKTNADISKLPVFDGNRKCELGQFFSISGTMDDDSILIENDCSNVKLIGSRMTRGKIEVLGNVGMHLGAGISGGSILVRGSATDWVGAEMKGGTIEILGDAGHLIGAAYRGASVGMRGGNLIVHGSCGNEVGSHMRRGLIAIGKNVGDFVGMGMIAGTIITAGSVGIRAGAEMKRGTLVFLSERPAMLPTFRFSCNYDPAFLTIYFNKLKQFNFPLLNMISPWSRYCGDLISLGRGEILCKAN